MTSLHCRRYIYHILNLFFVSLQLHTSELNDGFDWNRINFASVTEESSLEEFLATAELAGTEFTAGRLTLAEMKNSV